MERPDLHIDQCYLKSTKKNVHYVLLSSLQFPSPMQKIACLVIGVMLLCVGCSHMENVSVVELEEYSNNVWSDEKPQNEFVFNLYRTVVKS